MAVQNGDHRPQIAYLGPEASFSHQAAQEAFPSGLLVPLPSFSAILSALQNSDPSRGTSTSPTFDFAVLPVENSTNGAVVQALDLLVQCGLDPSSALYPDIEVVDEHYLEVHHCLYIHENTLKTNLPRPLYEQCLRDRETGLQHNTRGDKPAHEIIRSIVVQTLYSHPQVWGQCNEFLGQVFPPPVERVDTSSTSAAATYIANTPSGKTSTSTVGAAISSRLAGTKHNLVCLAMNIEDSPGNNTTRFLVLRNRRRRYQRVESESVTAPQPRKSLVTFTIPHSLPGSLASALAVFSRHEFNLTAIQSRPSRRRNWCYVFFVECECVATGDRDRKLDLMLDELRTYTELLCCLGSWEGAVSR